MILILIRSIELGEKLIDFWATLVSFSLNFRPLCDALSKPTKLNANNRNNKTIIHYYYYLYSSIVFFHWGKLLLLYKMNWIELNWILGENFWTNSVAYIEWNNSLLCCLFQCAKLRLDLEFLEKGHWSCVCEPSRRKQNTTQQQQTQFYTRITIILYKYISISFIGF